MLAMTGATKAKTTPEQALEPALYDPQQAENSLCQPQTRNEEIASVPREHCCAPSRLFCWPWPDPPPDGKHSP
jgi:hypothetical protein